MFPPSVLPPCVLINLVDFGPLNLKHLFAWRRLRTYLGLYRSFLVSSYPNLICSYSNLFPLLINLRSSSLRLLRILNILLSARHDWMPYRWNSYWEIHQVGPYSVSVLERFCFCLTKSMWSIGLSNKSGNHISNARWLISLFLINLGFKGLNYYNLCD